MKTAKIKVHLYGARFVAVCGFRWRNAVDKAGFNWDNEKREWYTYDPRIAARLREYASGEAEEVLEKVLLDISPWAGPIPYPKDLNPLPFQIPAARFSLSRNHSYQYAAPGMGKTIIATLIVNGWLSKNPDQRVVYMCPSFLVRNVENELLKWGLDVGVEHFDEPQLFGNVMILPSSLLHREELFKEMQHFFSLSKRPTPALIGDEAHQFKNDEAERTRILFGHKDRPALVDLFSKTVMMSGTAMPNRALELFPVLSKLAPQTIDYMNRDQFGMKYCAGRWNGFAYEYSGSSNLTDLAKRVQGTYMYKLKKSELKLPPLTEEVFVVADDLDPKLHDFETALLKEHQLEDLMKGRIEATFRYRDIPLPTYQRFLGLYKVKHAVDWIDDVMENSEESMIVFARHREVIARLEAECTKRGWKPIIISADMKSENRFEEVEFFQKTKARRLLIGSLRTMGLGFNITKATRVLHVEPAWTPADNDQGTDRAHRYGQKNPVFAEYMVYKNSVDHQVLKVVLRKRKLTSYL